MCFLIKGEKVLLAMKKRGFGAGRWNGVGGKVEEDEPVREAAARETEEEIGVYINPGDLREHGSLKFFFKRDNSDWDQEVYIFVAEKWEGDPAESEEMRSQWYAHSELPFHSMWPDDPHWLPKVLAGKKITGEFLFDKDGEVVEKFEVIEV